jgi:hypothetical protein
VRRRPTTARNHLIWLRDRVVCGVVFHTGARLYELDDKIVAAPISVLWDLPHEKEPG